MPSFPSLEGVAGTSQWGDILSWQVTFGPRTMRPGGQLVLEPHVRGESWSGGTAGPPTMILLCHFPYLAHYLPAELILT